MDRESVDSGSVYRASNPSSPRLVGDGEPKAHALDFARGSRDKVGLSVWDAGFTSPTQLRKIMEKPASHPVYELAVGELLGITNPDGIRLSVKRDPAGVPTERRGYPGAEGHCLLLGVIRPKGGSTSAYAELRIELARMAKATDVAPS